MFITYLIIIALLLELVCRRKIQVHFHKLIKTTIGILIVVFDILLLLIKIQTELISKLYLPQ